MPPPEKKPKKDAPTPDETIALFDDSADLLNSLKGKALDEIAINAIGDDGEFQEVFLQDIAVEILQNSFWYSITLKDLVMEYPNLMLHFYPGASTDDDVAEMKKDDTFANWGNTKGAPGCGLHYSEAVKQLGDKKMIWQAFISTKAHENIQAFAEQRTKAGHTDTNVLHIHVNAESAKKFALFGFSTFLFEKPLAGTTNFFERVSVPVNNGKVGEEIFKYNPSADKKPTVAHIEQVCAFASAQARPQINLSHSAGPSAQ